MIPIFPVDAEGKPIGKATGNATGRTAGNTASAAAASTAQAPAMPLGGEGPALAANAYLQPGMLNLTALPPLALYVHYPWCVRKCPYCDFNSHEAAAELPEAQYLDALRADLEAALPLIWGRKIYTIFIGGGTPRPRPPAVGHPHAAAHRWRRRDHDGSQSGHLRIRALPVIPEQRHQSPVDRHPEFQWRAPGSARAHP
jgi:hypothetical protein